MCFFEVILCANKNMATKKENIKDSMGKLEGIIKWFESQNEVDVEAGLNKFKEGALLIRELKGKLKSVENEFEEIKKSIE